MNIHESQFTAILVSVMMMMMMYDDIGWNSQNKPTCPEKDSLCPSKTYIDMAM